MSNSDAIWQQDTGIRASLGSAGKIRLSMMDDASNRVSVHSFHSMADGHWHHIVFTYDGSAGLEGLDVYVDGEIDSRHDGRAPMTGSTASDHPLAIVAPGAG